jgi:hypothetical protein
VYACKQFGVNDEIIKHMKRIIKTRQLPQTKLKILAEECKIEFKITLENCKTVTYKPVGEVLYSIPLYLIDNHYLLREGVNVSPYFIKHYDEIINNEKLKNWSLEEKHFIY